MTSKSQPRARGHTPIDMMNTEDYGQDEPAESSRLLDAGAEHRGRPDNKPTPDCYDDFIGLPSWKRPSVYWLVVPYFLYTIAFGGMIVPRIELIMHFVCHRYFAEQQLLDPSIALSPLVLGDNDPKCNSAPVHKNVATFTLVLSALAGGLSAFVAPKLGSWSDRYGRKRLLVAASCGGIMNEIITILTAKYPDIFDYRLLILGSAFDGITGSFTAAAVLGNSYVSDCTLPSNRGVALGYLQACLFTGLAFGPILAGKLTLLTGSVISIFYIALLCHVLVIFFFWFALPESLSKRRQLAAQEQHQAEQEDMEASFPGLWERSFRSRPPAWLTSGKLRTWLFLLISANPLAPLKMFVPAGRENQRVRRNLILLGFIDSVIMSAALGAGTVIILYAKFMFNWQTYEASRFISFVGFFRVIVLLIIFPTVNYFFRIRPLRRKPETTGEFNVKNSHSGADNLDVWLLRLALVSDLIGITGYVLVRTPALFMACGAFTAFGGLATATIQSSITKQVPANNVGAMLGAMGLLQAVSRVFSPIIFDGIYARTVETFPQAFTVVLASLFGLSVIASLFVRPHLFVKEDSYATIPSREPEDQNLVSAALEDDEMARGMLPRA